MMMDEVEENYFFHSLFSDFHHKIFTHFTSLTFNKPRRQRRHQLLMQKKNIGCKKFHESFGMLIVDVDKTSDNEQPTTRIIRQIAEIFKQQRKHRHFNYLLKIVNFIESWVVIVSSAVKVDLERKEKNLKFLLGKLQHSHDSRAPKIE